ncbi:MAG: Lysine-tRNA ligase [Parcubacteria group bacterium GW2011_GWF2_39_13b]|nr:MAG: Lysine-tRNA ligase [Parcubacteria group bacterium GW2011_GWF2_39_13b]
MSLDEIRQNYIKKAENIRQSGINPYPNKARRDFFIAEATEKFDELSNSKKEIYLVGRIKLLRPHGGSCFAQIEDAGAKIQIYFKKDILSEKYDFFLENFVVGDFIEVRGKMFLTKKEEKTLEVNDYKILAKVLRPMPEKWHGLKDIEERSRRRYLDLLVNAEIKEKFIKRSQIIKKLREFFDNEGFIEVETPILQPIPGGALAKPFKTHLNALDLDLYLRIAPELYLKRLLVGGLEKVFEIGKCFRNEGVDATHNPDFTEAEFYWAYADYNDLMDLTEKMILYLAPEKEIEFNGNKINLKSPWKRITLKNLILENLEIDIEKASQEEIMKKLKERGVKPEDNKDCRAIDALFKIIRPTLINPTFVIDYPIEMSPLAKSQENNPRITERIQLVIGGMELVNAYSELNDPIEQARRMKEQVAKHGEDVRYDEDYIEAMEYGMPPAAGWGMGVDRLVMLLTNTHNLRDIILFPTMRPK